jgi:hypothetical protein
MVARHRTLQHIADLEPRELMRGGFVMDEKFKARWILVVEDQPLVALPTSSTV